MDERNALSNGDDLVPCPSRTIPDRTNPLQAFEIRYRLEKRKVMNLLHLFGNALGLCQNAQK